MISFIPDLFLRLSCVGECKVVRSEAGYCVSETENVFRCRQASMAPPVGGPAPPATAHNYKYHRLTWWDHI